MSKPISLGFIQSDVNVQLRASRELLDAIRRLDTAIGSGDRQAIDEVIKILTRLTQDLVQNATRTGKTVAELLSGS